MTVFPSFDCPASELMMAAFTISSSFAGSVSKGAKLICGFSLRLNGKEIFGDPTIMDAEEDGWQIDGALEATAVCVPVGTAGLAVLEKPTVDGNAVTGGSSLEPAIELDGLPNDDPPSFVEEEKDSTFFPCTERRSMSCLVRCAEDH
jgi:hypothetical protein